MIAVEVRDGVTPPPEWGRLARGGPLAVAPPWLRSVAARAQGPGRWFLAVDTATGEPVAGLFGTIAEGARTDDAFNLFDVVTGTPRTLPLTEDAIAARAALRDAAPGADEWFPNLVLTLPSAECVPVGPAATDPAVTAALVDGILEWAAGEGLAAVAALYLRRRYSHLATALGNGGGFTRFALSYTGELHLPGTGFDDYLAMLSKHRRRSARKELETIASAGVRIERRLLADCLDDLVELRLSLKRKYGRTPNPQKERTSFTALADEFAPDQLHLLVAEARPKLIGFGLDVIYDGVWHGVVSGTDYDDPRSACVSFALDFYEPVRRAYEIGVRELQFGMAAWEAKRNRGCDLVALDGYVLPLRPNLANTVTASAAATTLLYSDTVL